MRIGVAALCCAILVTAAAPAFAEEPSAEHVIAPGQEQLLERLLGKDGAPGGCKLTSASIQRDHVEVAYACAGSPVSLELHHPSSTRPAVLRTDRFAVVAPAAAPPAPLLRDLEQSLRAAEPAWTWSRPPGAAPAGAGEDPEYQRGLDLYRAHKYDEAYDLYVALARKGIKPGVIGMVVASLASTHPSRERVAALTETADQHYSESAARTSSDRAPNDVLAQFVAGVAAHYYAHQSALTKAAKLPYYELAIKYLSRAEAAYAAEPRLWIYLAVSHFRLGHQREAEALIEKAVALGADDPDAYYCRAEIFQQKDIARSLADLDVYLAQMKKNEASTHITAPEKNARVQRMKEYLLAVQRGERKPVDLFDPAAEATAGRKSGGGLVPWWTALASLGGLAALLIGLRSVRAPTS
jgi:tetratricopeptide (TPR) repeat protein